MKENILVFPSSTIDAIKFANKNKDTCNLFGASSDYMLSNSEFFHEWRYLPYVNNSMFLEKLKIYLIENNINKIYASSWSVWNYLNTFIEENLLKITIINKPKHMTSIENMEEFRIYANYLYESYKFIENRKSYLSFVEFMTILHKYHQIAGESGDNKFIALMQIASQAAKGDIVEIGSFQGKSAFSLYALSKRYNIGKVLCIDPWEECIQLDSPKIIQTMSKENDLSRLFYNFIINLSFFKDDINYLRMYSDDAYIQYKNNSIVYSEEFGETNYKQKISILHIDGNHDYSFVYNDLKNYSEFLVDNAWIILDDYTWAYGDGPKQVGDDFLRSNSQNISNCFSTDSALFMQIKDASKIKIS